VTDISSLRLNKRLLLPTLVVFETVPNEHQPNSFHRVFRSGGFLLAHEIDDPPDAFREARLGNNMVRFYVFFMCEMISAAHLHCSCLHVYMTNNNNLIFIYSKSNHQWPDSVSERIHYWGFNPTLKTFSSFVFCQDASELKFVFNHYVRKNELNSLMRRTREFAEKRWWKHLLRRLCCKILKMLNIK